MLLTLISCVVGTCVFVSWEVSSVSFLLISLVSLLCVYQNFWGSLNVCFMGSTMGNILSFLACVLVFLCLISTPYEKSYLYLISLSFLAVFLIIAFSVSNIIAFYVFFEASLIPTLILIMGWGYQPERLQAGSYMMLYTVGASLPLLVTLIWGVLGSSTMEIVLMKNFVFSFPVIIVFSVYGAFLVKLPMYSTHLWLPKAHVEAPLVGSMILAGILLKLGGYGIYLMNFSFSMSLNWVSFLLISLSMWGGFIACLMCVRQVDIKALVAYSSIGHMGIVSSALILDQSWGLVSAIVTMLAHGFTSSALFCLAYFSYLKTHTRNIPYMKGFLQLYPVLSMWWFIMCCVNMAAPPSLNLVGELLVSVVLWKYNVWLAVVMGLMVFMSAAYNMYLYSSINHSFVSNFLTSGSSLFSYEKMSLILHFCPLLLLFKGQIFLSMSGKIISLNYKINAFYKLSWNDPHQ